MGFILFIDYKAGDSIAQNFNVGYDDGDRNLSLTTIKLSQNWSARFILQRAQTLENKCRINLALQLWQTGNP
jgi:hypothetical protein